MAELALYESWLRSLVEAALDHGELTPPQASMLERRRTEGTRQLWLAAAERGEPFRSYLARLLAMEDLLARLAGGS